MGNLATTNVLLGIMAAVSLLQGVLIVGIGVAAWKGYRLVGALDRMNNDTSAAMARVNAILDDVKAVSETVKEKRNGSTIHRTMDRVVTPPASDGRRAGSRPVVGFGGGARGRQTLRACVRRRHRSERPTALRARKNAMAVNEIQEASWQMRSIASTIKVAAVEAS